MALAAAIEADAGALDRLRETLSADKVLGSDARFKAALAAAAPAVAPEELRFSDRAGRVAGTVIFDKAGTRIRLDRGDADAFAQFLRAELPGLMERFAGRSRPPTS